MAFGGTSTGGQLDDLKEEFLNCNVCTRPYTMTDQRPKVLPCGHTYCMSCIDKLNTPHCPLCRNIFNLDDDGSVGLQDNLTIKKLMDILKVLPAEQTVGVTTCEECSRGLKSVSWCYHCRRQICEKCKECHAQMMSFSGHFVESLSNINLIDARKTFYCEFHKKQKLLTFCESCQEVICITCALTPHKGHIFVDLETVQDKHLLELNQMVDDVLCIQEKAILKSCIASRKTDMLDKNYRSCIDEIDSFFNKLQLTLNKTIEDQRNRLKENADTFKFTSIDQFKKETEEAEIFLSRIGSTVDTFQPILDRQCPVEVARALHDHSRSLKELVGQSKSLPGRDLTTESNTNKVAYSLLSFTHDDCDNIAASIVGSWKIGAFNVVPANTLVSIVDGVAGALCRLLITLRNRKNEPCSEATNHTCIRIEAAVYLDMESASRIDCKVQATTKPGEYEATFVPHVSGHYKAVLKIMGESVVSSSVISVCDLGLKILKDEFQNIVRVNVTKIDATNNSETSSDLQDVSVECIDPMRQSINPLECHVVKGILEAKFVLISCGQYMFRVLYRNDIMKSEDVFMKYQKIGQEGNGIGHLQNIADLVVLPSGTIIVLDLKKKGGNCRLSTWDSITGTCTGTTYTSIETNFQCNMPRLAVGCSGELYGCICYHNETTTSFTFFTHTPILKLKDGVELEENVKPIAIAMSSEGAVIVCTSQSNIEVFLPDGSLRKTIYLIGQDEGFQIKTPVDICVDLYDNVFICDSGNNCVHMLSSNYTFVKTFREASGINHPIAIAVSSSGQDGSGTLFVLEKRTISVINIEDGELIETVELSSRILLGLEDKIVCTTDDYIIITNRSKSHLIKCMYSNTCRGVHGSD